jgi:hypothetical protein
VGMEFGKEPSEASLNDRDCSPSLNVPARAMCMSRHDALPWMLIHAFVASHSHTRLESTAVECMYTRVCIPLQAARYTYIG